MTKKIRFVDSVHLEPVFEPELKDFYQDPSQNLSSLRIKLAATHAGKITKNNGFYLPHKMRDGAASFTAQYPKPIQVHHDDRQDPVGRVVSARYVDLSGGIQDAWNKSDIKDDTRMSQDMFSAFCRGKFIDSEAVDVANKYFIQDEAITDDPDYEGLGYIEIVADITDPDAIRKVLDKRYLTGSVGASTDSAVCSICKTDWAKDDICEHRLGKRYEDKKCVLIAGSLEYDEWSFVNAPADTHSSVIEVHTDGVQDSVKQEDNDRKMDNTRVEFLDHKQEDPKDQNIKAVVMKTGEYEGHKHIARLDEDGDGETNYATKIQGDDEEETDWGHEHVVNAWVVQKADGHTHALDNPLKKSKDTKQEDKSKEEPSMVNLKDGKQDVSPAPPADDVDNTPEPKVEDATPPVETVEDPPAKVADDKVDDGAVDDKDKDAKSSNPLDEYQDEDLIKFFGTLRQMMEDRGLSEDADEGTEDPAVEPDSTEPADAAKPAETLDALKAEVARLMEDIVTLNGQLADALQDNKDMKVQKIHDFSKLLDAQVEMVKLEDGAEVELKDASGEAIDKILSDLAAKVDIPKIADTINSGLSNPNPQGTVDNPVNTPDEIVEDKKETTKLTKAQLANIKANYIQLSFSSQTRANQYIADLKAKGILPQGEFQIEDKS